MVLEVTPESGLVGEVQAVGNLLDAHFGAFQVFPREYHGDTCYPLQGTLAAPLADDGREIVRRQVLLVGVILHGALTVAILIYRYQEAAQYRVVPALRHGFHRSVAKVNFEYFQAKGIAQMAHAVGPDYIGKFTMPIRRIHVC